MRLMSVAELLTAQNRSRDEKLAWAEKVLRQAEQKAGVTQEAHLAPEDFLPAPTPQQEDLLGVLGVPLAQGSLVGVAGSTALLLTMLGIATAEEKWAAVVGMPTLGLAAAEEYGVDLARLVLIPNPGPHAAEALAAVIDGFDVVVAGEGLAIRPGQRRSLLGRARNQRTTVFTPLWPEVPTRLEAQAPSWKGVGNGHGYLRERQIEVRCSGRGGERLVQIRLPRGTSSEEQELRHVS